MSTTGARFDTKPGSVLIGCGAGFAGDRLDASQAIIGQFSRSRGPRYLIFEVLAERTLAICQNLKRENQEAGFSPFLEAYLEPILVDCAQFGIRIITNAGAANPAAAARRVADIARSKGLTRIRIGVVEGDDLLQRLTQDEIAAKTPMDNMRIERPILSANVYLGSASIVEALACGADIVITGRCADPSLALGPLIYEFGWSNEDWDRLAGGTLVGHLIECGGQVSGAAFADPGFKDGPGLDAAGLARLGYPIAEVTSDGCAIIGKPDETGGLVSQATVREQMLYEIHDPSCYITPDVVLDMTEVDVVQVAQNRVRVSGARGKPAPAMLKTTVSFDGGWLGEAELSYAGVNSLARAKLAVEVLEERLRLLRIDTPHRLDIIGLSSILDNDAGNVRKGAKGDPDGDYRIRIAARGKQHAVIQRILHEMLGLWAAGPAGAAGFRDRLERQVFTASVLVDRRAVMPKVTIV